MATGDAVNASQHKELIRRMNLLMAALARGEGARRGRAARARGEGAQQTDALIDFLETYTVEHLA